MDILSIDHEKFNALSMSERDALTVRCDMISGIDSVPVLSKRLHECLHWNTLNSTPLTGKYLNRVYGRVAFKLGTNVNEQLCDLIGAGHVTLFSHRDGKKTYVSRPVFEHARALITEYELNMDEAMAGWTTNVR